MKDIDEKINLIALDAINEMTKTYKGMVQKLPSKRYVFKKRTSFRSDEGFDLYPLRMYIKIEDGNENLLIDYTETKKNNAEIFTDLVSDFSVDSLIDIAYSIHLENK